MAIQITRVAQARLSANGGPDQPGALPDVIVFDLDETIYSRRAGVMQAIGQRITLYLEQYLGLSTAAALDLRQRYMHEFGTTLRGLQVHEQVDSDLYMEFVHDVPIETFLQHNPRLDATLAGMPCDKVIFTNASCEHAERVLAALGVRRHFSQIVDVRQMDWISKPHPHAYPRLIERLGLCAERSMLVEDNVRNLRPAADLGMWTTLVDAADDENVVHFVIDEIWEIGQVFDLLAGHETPEAPCL